MEILFVLIPLIIGLAIFIAVIASGLSSKCPACGKWWGLKMIERKEISREPGMKVVNRKETQHDSKGNATQIERQVQVRVMRITYDGSFRCNACSHSLNKPLVEEKESW